MRNPPWQLSPGQEKFIFKLSRLAPEFMWLTQLSPQVKVGDTVRGSGMRGVISMLFMNHLIPGPENAGSVVAWEDGSVKVPAALLDFLASVKI